MFNTLKKILRHEKKVKKEPLIDTRSSDSHSREDYHIPEPDDIRRLPNPNFGTDIRREPVNNRAYNVPENREPRLAPTPEPPTFESKVPFRGPTNIDEVLSEIMYRLDDIDKRLANLERNIQPPVPRRY